jgi:predicted acetylornithine/succinylornithine family transaminase
MKMHELKTYDQQYILQTYTRYPIALIKGDGAKVWDINGKEYLDFLSGIAVNPLGHCHPNVMAAVIKQVQKLMHVSNLYYTKPATLLAKLLVENGGLDKIFFCNSGAEANEAAIKLARKYHWRKGETEKIHILACGHSFHGRTLATLSATDKPQIKEGFGIQTTDFSFIEFNNVQELENSINAKTAAVFIEPVQGEGGIHVATKEFLEAARTICNKYNSLLIFDEIQCGLCRIGSLFAYQSFAVKPDVITLAKGIANGLPLGALCVTDEAAKGLQFGDHATTFGGNPIATAAALATINTLLEENYANKVLELGEYLLAKLQMIKSRYPENIKEIRGKGLMIGIEFYNDAQQILEQCHTQGLLVNVTAGNVLRLLPPYVITHKDIDVAVEIIEQSLHKVNNAKKNSLERIPDPELVKE